MNSELKSRDRHNAQLEQIRRKIAERANGVTDHRDASRIESLIGKTGRVLSRQWDTTGRYEIELEGEVWLARPTPRRRFRKGSRVRVVGAVGLTLLVVPATA